MHQTALDMELWMCLYTLLFPTTSNKSSLRNRELTRVTYDTTFARKNVFISSTLKTLLVLYSKFELFVSAGTITKQIRVVV